MNCQCGQPDELGTHWLAEDGECCPPGCECQDCVWWAPYKNIKLEVRDEYGEN